jgi:pyruvate dehydrogenase E1 component alpha subunit
VKAPVVFVLQNNGYAISTPRSKQSAATNFAARAAGYGLPGVVVDGNDLLAVYEVARDAVQRARAGEGATLIESQTYRLYPHNTADDQSRYVSTEELEVRRGADPIPRVRNHLAGLGVLDEADEAAMQRSIDEEISTAIVEAEAHAPANVTQVFEHVYANPWSRVTRQRDEFVRDAEGL